MPAVIVHVPKKLEALHTSALVDDVRNAVSVSLHIPASSPVVFLYDTPPERRSVLPERGEDLVYVQSIIKAGRSLELKNSLHKAVKAAIMKHTGLPSKGILSIIIEVPEENVDLV